MTRLKLLAAAAALTVLPLFTPAAQAGERHHGDRRSEVFYRDGCRVERVWRSHGRYSETVDCRSGRPGHYHRGWRDDDRDDDRTWRHGRDWRDDRGWESQHVGGWFDDRRRNVVRSYYGRDCHPYRSDWGRPYHLGREFPHGHHWRSVSHDLNRRLGPPPRGYVYGRYNDDVLLIREATRLVVDAILLNDRRHRW